MSKNVTTKQLIAAVQTIASALDFPVEREDRDSGEMYTVNGIEWAQKSLLSAMIWKIDQLHGNTLNGRFDKFGRLERWGEGVKQLQQNYLMAMEKRVDQDTLDILEAKVDDKAAEAAVFGELGAKLRAAYAEVTGKDYARPQPEQVKPMAKAEASLTSAEIAKRREEFAAKAKKMGLEDGEVSAFVERCMAET